MMKVSLVNGKAGLLRHGYGQAGVLAVLSSTSCAGVDPFSIYETLMMEKLRTPQWFEKNGFATGKMPMSTEPGFQSNSVIYHKGAFHGAVATGGKTHGFINPELSFNSLKVAGLEKAIMALERRPYRN